MTMPVLTLNCNNCGAPLTVPDSTRFLTCQFCQSQLEVMHEGNAAFTQVLEQLQERTNQISSEVNVLKLQNELLLLDQQWDRRSSKLMVHNKHGHPQVPTMTGVVLMAVVGGVVTVVAGTINVMFGVVAAIILTIGLINLWHRANEYASAERRYKTEKRRIQSEISRLR